jgi:hypothetical protein
MKKKSKLDKIIDRERKKSAMQAEESKVMTANKSDHYHRQPYDHISHSYLMRSGIYTEYWYWEM